MSENPKQITIEQTSNKAYLIKYANKDNTRMIFVAFETFPKVTEFLKIHFEVKE